MTDKDLLKQMLQREVVNLVETTVPQFRMFSGIASDYLFEYIEPYIDAFLSPDDGTLNKKAAGAYLKQETNEKIDRFLKEFEANKSKE
jgi:hypothetical protein